ncbi:Ig-like domain-containing protein, partial [Escherichia coli]
DKNGNPLKDKEITFSVPNDVASKFSISNGGKGMTDSNGVAIASLTGTLAGTHMITARLANSNVSDTQPMTFVADKDRAVVVLQTSKAEIIGNGVDETTLTATVKDPSNHPVAGITVNFTMPQDVAANFTLENNGIAITQANG